MLLKQLGQQREQLLLLIYDISFVHVAIKLFYI